MWYYIGFMVSCLVLWWWNLAMAISNLQNNKPYRASLRFLLVFLFSVIVATEFIALHNAALSPKASTVPTRPTPKDDGPEVKEPSVYPI